MCQLRDEAVMLIAHALAICVDDIPELVRVLPACAIQLRAWENYSMKSASSWSVSSNSLQPVIWKQTSSISRPGTGRLVVMSPIDDQLVIAINLKFYMPKEVIFF